MHRRGGRQARLGLGGGGGIGGEGWKLRPQLRLLACVGWGCEADEAGAEAGAGGWSWGQRGWGQRGWG